MAFGQADGRFASWDDFHVALDRTWQQWCNSPDRYTRTMERLPRLLASAHYLRRRQAASSDAERGLGGAYRLARSLLTRLGEHELALHAAYRALDVAQHAPDRLAAVAACVWHAAGCLLQLGYYQDCGHLAAAAAGQLDELAADTDRVSLSGALQLLQAEAAAAALDSERSRRHLELAGKAAETLGRDTCRRGIWFGPTEIGIVGMQIALRLGDIGDALRQARDYAIPPDYPIERRSRYHIALALAHTRRADDAAAVLALAQAHRECPEELRFDQTAQQNLALLIRRDNKSIRAEITRLATAAGF